MVAFYVGASAGCTSFLVPGWAAIAVVAIAAAPRLARELLSGSEG